MFRILERLLIDRLPGGADWPPLERQFLFTQITSSIIALGAFPLWILWHGSLTSEMAVIFGWLIGPLMSAMVLIRIRSLSTAFFVSSISLTGLICTICAFTGGFESFALVWLVAVPFEVARSRRRRDILYSFLPVVLGLLLLFQGDVQGWFGQHEILLASDPLGFLMGPLAVVIYAMILTLKFQSGYNGSRLSLAANEERYRLLAENSTDLVTQHDVSGNVVFASPATRTLLGVAPDLVNGKGLFEKVHVADRPAYMQLLSNVVARGLPLAGEFRLKTIVQYDGEHVYLGDKPTTVADYDYSWVEMHCRPVWDGGHIVTGAISILRDVSARHHQEEELRKAHNNLQELSDAKSRFLANMSHELRTPLNAIIGFSEILEQELFGKFQNEKQKEYVTLIGESGKHLLQVVTDILDMSKIESGTFDIVSEAFDVDNLVRTCTSIMSQQAEARGIELSTIVPDHLPEAVADSRACRQILINLISNALKFSDEGDRVVVGARLEGHSLAYFVRDSGIGMSQSDLKRIGQPFFQADNSLDRRYEGTGLGVSVVKGLTELHKGKVVFESVIGKGTCVTVFIPLNCEVDDDITVELDVLESDNSDTNEVQAISMNDQMIRKTA